MPKPAEQKGLKERETKTRGRTSISKKPAAELDSAPHVQNTHWNEVNRVTSAGAGKQRGDRRDMSKTYAGTQRHSSRGNNSRVDVSTRKR